MEWSWSSGYMNLKDVEIAWNGQGDDDNEGEGRGGEV